MSYNIILEAETDQPWDQRGMLLAEIKSRLADLDVTVVHTNTTKLILGVFRDPTQVENN